MDQSKLMNSVVDTAIMTSHELLTSTIQLKAEIRVMRDVIQELSENIARLTHEKEVATKNEQAVINKASHLDNALGQLGEANKKLSEANNRIIQLETTNVMIQEDNNELSLKVEKLTKQLENLKPKTSKKKKEEVTVEEASEPISTDKPSNLDDF